MEAFVQLALMAKAKLVFESEETFLSFRLLSPWTVEPDRLRFSGEVTQQRIADLSEFSRMTNCIPRGIVAPEEQGEYLWDVYREILDTAQIAGGAMSQEQREQYEQALGLLYVTAEDGMRQDSPALQSYRQHRDSHIAAVEEYKNRQLTAESSDDPEAKARWTQEEALLREAVDLRMSQWCGAGRKEEIETALRTEEAHAAREPSPIWEQWRSSFNDDLDISTDLSNQEFALTGFSPYDVFDQGEWASFTLSREEMTGLTAQPPPELSPIFGEQVVSDDVESVTFEYRSVAITRPWLRPAVFRSRFWRLGAEGGELSDGATPPGGYCPAYVTGLVFARNVTVKRRASEEAPADRGWRVGEMLRLDATFLERAQVLQEVEQPSMPLIRRAVVAPDRVDITLGERAAIGVAIADSASPRLLAARHATRLVSTEAIDAAEPPPVRRLDIAARLRGTAFGAGMGPLIVEQPVDPPEGSTQPDPPVDTATTSNEITVLALVCKRLPRCPDPDPALSWG